NVENTLQNYIEQRAFFYDVWLPFVNDAKTPLIELSFIQYPLLGKTTNPARPVEFAKQTFNRVFLEYIRISNDNHCSRLIVTFNKVREEHKQNVDLSQKYPKIEKWREFYCNPEKPYLLNDKHRNRCRYPDDEEWEKYKTKENHKLKKLHRQFEQRKKQYFDIVQPLLFKYLPDLDNIENDHWVIYAVTLRDFYEEWKTICETADTTIQYKMPPESIWWEYKDWDKLLTERLKQYPEKLRQ
ncbi:MAG: hypothetical protein IID46_00350, partial [Planctomycetes bacterium]|nr:hypothetical protein [Planctomycetota bacterium]